MSTDDKPCLLDLMPRLTPGHILTLLTRALLDATKFLLFSNPNLCLFPEMLSYTQGGGSERCQARLLKKTLLDLVAVTSI